MSTFEEFLNEAIQVNHSAYQRAHQKKASGKGNWMVGVGTHDIDFKKHKEGEHYISHNGTASEAAKKAKELAKKHGHSSVHFLP
ncbi:hypothetical protein [Xanthomonas phage BUDD]|nr:hypothetical protein [Xanthomonas phage BUDD]